MLIPNYLVFEILLTSERALELSRALERTPSVSLQSLDNEENVKE